MDVTKFGRHGRRPAGQIIGVDLGQANDFTAIVVLDRIEEYFEKAHDGKTRDVSRWHFEMRHAQRLPIGTPYPDVAEIVGRMVKELSVMVPTGPRDHRLQEPKLIVDSTGVGKPVVDMMRRLGLKPVAVAITGGREEGSGGDFNRSVPKRNLVFSLVVAFQEARLKISAGIPAAAELLNELINFKVKVSATGHESFDAWRDSIHDDLVLAAALAVWWGDRHRGASVIPLNEFFSLLKR